MTNDKKVGGRKPKSCGDLVKSGQRAGLVRIKSEARANVEAIEIVAKIADVP